MNKDKFLCLRKGQQLQHDGLTYEVMDTDRMGRVRLRQVTFFYDSSSFEEDYDTYEECEAALEKERDDAEKDGGVPDWLRDTTVQEHKTLAPFWIHYKDIL